MKKKWLVLGSAVGISSIVMLSTGFSAMASTSGYDTYKAALKNTKTIQSVTVQGAAALKDNGKVLVDASGSFKVSHDNHAASGSSVVKANGMQQSLNVYNQNNETVFKSDASDVYYVNQEKEKHSKVHDPSQGDMSQHAETVIDALVGNLKDYVTVSPKDDGSKEVSVQLENAQIPTVINALAPIVISHATKQGHGEGNIADKPKEQLFNKDMFKSVMPQMTQEIKIDKVAVKANINADNYIEHQEADVTVSGKDDNGATHQVTLHLQADLSGYNNTTPDTIDLTGKNVQQIKHDHKGFGQEKENE
jgi:hypothetical protein